MDVLADVLAAARIGGAVTARVNAAAPWGIGFPQMPTAAFHAVIEGTCWLRCPGSEPVRLAAGDVALMAAGQGHAVSSDRSGPTTLYEDVIAPRGGGDAVADIDLPGSGPRTRVICGGYRLDARASPLLLNLPPLLILPANPSDSRRDLTETLRMLAAELTDPRPGSQTVTDRLVDVLFVHILRQWTTAHDDTDACWLTALRDAEIARAIILMHQSPAHPWTVEELARRVGVSRATLSRRFTRLVGEPPLAYLTRWRLELAARKLRESTDSLSNIAHSVGYTSEFAFSRAFSRRHGIAPSRYRSERSGP